MIRNEMGKKRYIINMIYGNIIFLWIYYITIFSAMKGFSELQSFILLIVAIFMGALLDLLLLGRYARNWRNIVITIPLVPGAYTIYTYLYYRSDWCKKVLCVAGMFWGCYVIVLFVRRIKEKADCRRIILSRMRRAYWGAKYVGALVCTMVIIIALIDTCISHRRLGCVFGIEATAYNDEDSLAANMEQVLKMQPEEYSKLTVDEKVELLQVMADIQGRYLGLDRRVTVKTSSLENDRLGYYRDSTAVIQIDTEHLSDDPQSVLETLYHEMFHAAQHQYAHIYDQVSEENKKSYFLMDAEIYAEEIKNYENGENDILEYYAQKLEQDARAHGIIDAQQVYDRIEEYLTTQEENAEPAQQEETDVSDGNIFAKEEPLVSKETFYRGDTVMQIQDYEYDEQNRLTMENIYQLNENTGEMGLSFRYDYAYDDDFCYQNMTYTNENNRVAKTILDANGNAILSQEIIRGNLYSQTYSYKYSMDTERRKESYCYAGEGKDFFYYDVTLYNRHGDPTFQLVQRPDSSISVCKIDYEYNDENQLVRITKTYREGENRETIDDTIVESNYTYGEDGMLEKEVWTSCTAGSKTHGETILYQYDEQGREIRREEHSLTDEDTIWVKMTDYST